MTPASSALRFGKAATARPPSGTLIELRRDAQKLYGSCSKVMETLVRRRTQGEQMRTKGTKKKTLQRDSEQEVKTVHKHKYFFWLDAP